MKRTHARWQSIYAPGLSLALLAATGCALDATPRDALDDAAEEPGTHARATEARTADLHTEVTSGPTSVCAGGTAGKDSSAARPPGLTVSREYAAVKYLAPQGVEILDMKTTLRVPKLPTSRQTLFIWPALQNRAPAPDPARVLNGILQPVLTWGPSCNPRRPRNTFDKWWMAAMYVNVSSRVAGPTGCAGGDFMLNEVGDLLDIDIAQKGTAWTQMVANRRSGQAVDFTIDLNGQVQNWATWAVEVPTGETIVPADDTLFTDSALTFSKPVTSCQPSQAGAEDTFSAPVLSPDGLHCCYDEVRLARHASDTAK